MQRRFQDSRQGSAARAAPDGGLPPDAGATGVQGEPVYPVGFEIARFHPAQPVHRIHFRHGAGADQVGDKTHDFGKFSIHPLKIALKRPKINFRPLHQR